MQSHAFIARVNILLVGSADVIHGHYACTLGISWWKTQAKPGCECVGVAMTTLQLGGGGSGVKLRAGVQPP